MASQGAEALLARAVLLKLGDSTQREAIVAGLHKSDVATRRAVITVLSHVADLLITALRDADADLRLLAARELTELKDPRAIPVLRETMTADSESPRGLQAYALLHRFNVKVDPPKNARRLLDSSDPYTRAAALRALLAQDPQGAVPELQKASHDLDRSVRLEVAELAVSLVPAGAGRPLLRTLVKDADPTVRARAGKLLSGSNEQTEPAEPATAAGPPQSVPGGPAQPPVGPQEAPAESAPDDARSAADTSNPVHSASILPSIQKLVRAGADDFEHMHLANAQRQLEKAAGLCAAQKAKVCASVAYDLAYCLGRALEAQGEYADALTEFDRLPRLHSSSSAQRSYVAAAVQWLSPKVGRVTVSKPGKQGKCVTTEYWLRPGAHEIRIDSKRTETVVVASRQHKEIKACP